MLEEPIKEGDSGLPKMKGSAMLIGAKTREEVEDRLKKDVYVEGGVWDLSVGREVMSIHLYLGRRVAVQP